MREAYTGRDSKVIVSRLTAGKLYPEPAVQQLYPLQLSYDITTPAPGHMINTEADDVTDQIKMNNQRCYIYERVFNL